MKPKPKPKRKTKAEEYREVLEKISKQGDGIKENLISWENIGKWSKHQATEVLKPKCKGCGK